MAVYDYKQKDDNLEYLKNLDDHVIEWNEPDIRGWEMIGADGESMGKVHDLVIKKEDKKVVYADMHLNTELTEGENDHAMIPVGFIDIDDEKEKVKIDVIGRKHSELIPKYNGGEIYKDYEDLMASAIDDIIVKEEPKRHYEEHELYTDDRLYDRRRRNDRDTPWTTTPTKR
jgi:sporulation protein YlmC with PRC-barrel domain